MATLCKSCAGKLIFDPKAQKLICKMCGQTYAPEEIEDASKSLLEDSGKLRDAKIYICNTCGAEVELNDNEASSFCLYCGNATIVFSRIAKQRCPDKIIPFKISKRQAMDKLIPYLRTSKALDKDQKYLWLEKIRGIYVPYWLVEGVADIKMQTITEVDTFSNAKPLFTTFKGTLETHDLPISGSDQLPIEYLEQIGTWDIREAVPFDEDYLVGYYSDVTDIDFSALKRNAEKKCRELFWHKLKLKHDVVASQNYNMSCEFNNTKKPEYLMVPIWFQTVNNRDGSRSTFMMNGQTGECYGAFPAKLRTAWSDILKKTYMYTLFSIPIIFVLSIFLDRVWPETLIKCILVTLFFAGIFGGTGLWFYLKALKHNEFNATASGITTDYTAKRKEG